MIIRKEELKDNIHWLESPMYLNSKFYDRYIEIKFPSVLDISIIDNRLAAQVYIDYGILLLDTRVEDICYVNIHINTNRHFDDEGRFLGLAHNEFMYDEYKCLVIYTSQYINDVTLLYPNYDYYFIIADSKKMSVRTKVDYSLSDESLRAMIKETIKIHFEKIVYDI